MKIKCEINEDVSYVLAKLYSGFVRSIELLLFVAGRPVGGSHVLHLNLASYSYIVSYAKVCVWFTVYNPP